MSQKTYKIAQLGDDNSVGGANGSPVSPAVAQATQPQAGDTPGYINQAAYLVNPSWGSGHTFRDGNKDGLHYVQNFTDAAGSNSPMTYNQGFGIRMTKQNQGSFNAFWARVVHQGSGQGGLFIGDITADATGLGGDVWGGDLFVTFNIAANSTGLRIAYQPNVDVSSKVQQALEIANQNDTFALTQGIRVRGNFTNPIIVYSDALATTPIFFLDLTGNARLGGSISPITPGTNDLGSASFKWRNAYLLSTAYVSTAGAPTLGGGSGGMYLGYAGVNPTSSPSGGGFLYTDTTSKALQWYGSDGTNGKVLIGAPAGPTARTRALGTAYQPNASRTTMVIVSMNMSAAAGATTGVKIQMDASNPPTTEIARTDISPAAGVGGSVTSNVPITFIVPAGFYYEIVNLGGSPPIVETMEYTL